MKKHINSCALLVILLMWGLHLAYPMHHLQDIRWSFFGRLVPVYYFFTVALMLIAAALVLGTKRGWTKWELLWWLLPLICLPGIVFSDDRLWSLRQWLSWIIRGVIPGGILFLAAPRKKIGAILQYFIYPIIIAASLLGLVEIFFNYNPLAEIPYTVAPATAQPDNPFYRQIASHLPFSPAPQGTQTSRIPYAATLVGFLPLGLWFLKYRTERRSAHLAALAILIPILLLAQVRAVWVATVATLVLMQVVGLHKGRDQALKAAAALLLLLGASLALPATRGLIWSRLNSFHLAEGSIEERLDILQTAAVLKDRPLQGVGFGQFPTAARPYYHGIINWYGTPDNQYFRWLLENGIPSFVLLLAFFAGLVRAAWKKIRGMPEAQEADLYKSLLVGWLAVAVTFLSFDGFYWGACSMTFWCLLGLFATSLRPEAER